ncbi:MAG: hypothetical protein R2991_10150 [Thermoanaerobaculia bacterium]
MSGPLLLALLLAAGAAVAWARSHRRRRLRERETAARFEAFAERLGVGLERLDRGWRATSGTDGASFRVPERAILDAARRSERDGEPDAEERWRVQLAWRRAPLAPLATAFHLKAHGPRVLLQLTIRSCATSCREIPARCGLSPGAAGHAVRARRRRRQRSDVVTEEALREAGVDGRDLKGHRAGGLRQPRLDEKRSRALGGELVEIRPAHGCGAAGDPGRRRFPACRRGSWPPCRHRTRCCSLLPVGATGTAELGGRQPDDPCPGLLEIAPSGPRWAEVP